jgi:hypothetical protein
METNTIIAIVIAAVIIVVLSYYTYSYKSQYDLIKEALGKDSTTLESLLVKVKAAETQQSISQKEIEDNRKLIEEQKAKVQNLMDNLNTSNVSLEQKTKDLADARKGIYKANDYLLDTYFGSDKKSMLRIRRLRDLILLNLHNARKGFCKMIQKSESYIKMMEMLKYIRNTPQYSKIDSPAQKTAALNYAEQQYKAYNDKITSLSANNNMRVYQQMTMEEQVAQFIIQGAQMCSNSSIRGEIIKQIDTIRKTPANQAKQWNDAANADPNFRSYNPMGNPGEIMFNQPDWIALIDELEKVFMGIYDKSCAGGFPNYVMFINILESWMNSFCQEDNTDFNDILSRPLDMALIKSSGLFL